MIGAVNWWLAGLIGLVVGAALAWLVGRLVEAARNPPDTLVSNVRALEVDPALSRALEVREAPGIVVGPHDEVLYATETARTAGLVQGTRIQDTDIRQVAINLRIIKAITDNKLIWNLKAAVVDMDICRTA